MCPLENCFKVINIFDNQSERKLNIALMLTDLFKVKVTCDSLNISNICILVNKLNCIAGKFNQSFIFH